MATTGRYVVVMSDEVHGDQAAIEDALRSLAGVTSIASTTDFEASALDVSQAAGADAMVFAELGIAVVTASVGDCPGANCTGASTDKVLSIRR
jgi:hypothetical protein